MLYFHSYLKSLLKPGVPHTLFPSLEKLFPCKCIFKKYHFYFNDTLKMHKLWCSGVLERICTVWYDMSVFVILLLLDVLYLPNYSISLFSPSAIFMSVSQFFLHVLCIQKVEYLLSATSCPSDPLCSQKTHAYMGMKHSILVHYHNHQIQYQYYILCLYSSFPSYLNFCFLFSIHAYIVEWACAPNWHNFSPQLSVIFAVGTSSIFYGIYFLLFV